MYLEVRAEARTRQHTVRWVESRKQAHTSNARQWTANAARARATRPAVVSRRAPHSYQVHESQMQLTLADDPE